MTWPTCGGAAMTSLAFSPVALPLGTAVLLLFLHHRVRIQRWVSFVSLLAGLALAGYLMARAARGDIVTMQASGWPAPFGITSVVDRFSALMLGLSALLGLVTYLFALQVIEPGREVYFFHPMLQLQLAGINLAFVTGDIFNLFVAFEVMLMASYFLMTWGSQPGQLREGFKYLILNATASTLFLVAVAVLYGAVGTLNMADIAVKVASAPHTGAITVAAVLFLIVFGSKAALFPLYFWLPYSYQEAPLAIVVLFAGMLTKVGVYALIRVFTLLFRHDPGFTLPLLVAVGIATMVTGVLGALAQKDMKRLLSFHIVSQVGYMVLGLGLFTPLALAGAVLHLAHNVVVKSCLFLCAGVVERVTGTSDLRRLGGLVTTHPGLAALFLVAALSIAGIPPLSGFFSKYTLILAGVQGGRWGAVAAAVAVGLLTLASMLKIWRMAFWGEVAGPRHAQGGTAYRQMIFAGGLLAATSLAMGLAARPVLEYVQAVADQLLDPHKYIAAVLGGK